MDWKDWILTGIVAPICVAVLLQIINQVKKCNFIGEKRIIDDYLSKLETEYKGWRGLGLGRNVLIEDIYISHFVNTPFKKSKKELLHEDSFINEILKKRVQNQNILIEGPPGSGKTMLLKHFTLMLASRKNKNPLANYIPILLPLGKIGQKIVNKKDWNLPLVPLVEEQFQDSSGNVSPLFSCFLANAINRGRAIVMLDALDEVPKEASSGIKNWIDNIRKSAEKCPLIITSRPYDLCRGIQGMQTFSIEPFSIKQRELFISKWFQSSEAKDLGDKMKEQINNNSNLNVPEVAGNPLFLTMMCIEYEVNKEMPLTNGDLLKQFTRTLLQNWDRERGVVRKLVTKEPESVDTELQVLESIAYWLFERDVFRVSEDELIRNTTSLLSKLNYHLQADEIIKKIEVTSGILQSDNRGNYKFCHSIFQEFFVASYLIRDAKQKNTEEWNENIREFIKKNKKNPRYENIMRFFFDLYDDKTENRAVEWGIING